MIGPRILGIVFGLLTAFLILRMLRSRRMREKYAIIWGIVAILILAIAIFPDIATVAAAAIGVRVPLNLILIIGGLAGLVLSVQFSAELSRSQERVRRLAEEVAILRADLDAILPPAPPPAATPPTEPPAADPALDDH